MALTHSTIELDGSPTIVSVDTGIIAAKPIDLSVQNLDASATIFIGSIDVTTTSYGAAIGPGELLTITALPWRDELYAVTDTPGSKVAVLRIDR
jgi:hypothetical protein